jgi:hypothetical protein
MEPCATLGSKDISGILSDTAHRCGDKSTHPQLPIQDVIRRRQAI